MPSESAANARPEAPRVLVVCTANICRSPVAERLLERAWAERGKSAVVRSAGIRASERPPHIDTIVAAQMVDIDISEHRARTATRDIVNSDGADLIVGLTREHLRHIVGLESGAWRRTFTLKELARRATAMPASDDMAWADWIAMLAAGRKPADYMVPDPADDVSDPFGKPAAQHAAMVAEVVRHVDRVAAATP